MLPSKPELYSFLFAGGPTNAYTFTTEPGAAYLIRFRPAPYFFPDEPTWSADIYEMVIDLVREAPVRAAPDPRIGVTVVAICEDFLRKEHNVLVYICETGDGRHTARVRKFDGWFKQTGPRSFAKIDTQFPDPSGIVYYVSLIIRPGNPNFLAIMAAFQRFSAELDADK
jgi:hypothetical protein